MPATAPTGEYIYDMLKEFREKHTLSTGTPPEAFVLSRAEYNIFLAWLYEQIKLMSLPVQYETRSKDSFMFMGMHIIRGRD